MRAFPEAEEGKDRQGLHVVCRTSHPVWYGKIRMEVPSRVAILGTSSFTEAKTRVAIAEKDRENLTRGPEGGAGRSAARAGSWRRLRGSSAGAVLNRDLSPAVHLSHMDRLCGSGELGSKFWVRPASQDPGSVLQRE
ncbi:hypothetical protein ACRRTK_007428 [Alexandromys fortis]